VLSYLAWAKVRGFLVVRSHLRTSGKAAQVILGARLALFTQLAIPCLRSDVVGAKTKRTRRCAVAAHSGPVLDFPSGNKPHWKASRSWQNPVCPSLSANPFVRPRLAVSRFQSASPVLLGFGFGCTQLQLDPGSFLGVTC
jgi:hypothetical protein